jgi:hypothetical protein
MMLKLAVRQAKRDNDATVAPRSLVSKWRLSAVLLLPFEFFAPQAEMRHLCLMSGRAVEKDESDESEEDRVRSGAKLDPVALKNYAFSSLTWRGPVSSSCVHSYQRGFKWTQAQSVIAVD